MVAQTPTGKGLPTHPAHRKTLLCPLHRVTRATASRAAAARGEWTAESWRVGPPQHSAPLFAAAAAATNRCLPAAWLPPLTVRPLVPLPLPSADPRLDAPLPWDHIDTGISKWWLKTDLQRALEAATVPDCSHSGGWLG